jgi:hypothetical protein
MINWLCLRLRADHGGPYRQNKVKPVDHGGPNGGRKTFNSLAMADQVMEEPTFNQLIMAAQMVEEKLLTHWPWQTR